MKLRKIKRMLRDGWDLYYDVSYTRDDVAGFKGVKSDFFDFAKNIPDDTKMNAIMHNPTKRIYLG